MPHSWEGEGCKRGFVLVASILTIFYLDLAGFYLSGYHDNNLNIIMFHYATLLIQH